MMQADEREAESCVSFRDCFMLLSASSFVSSTSTFRAICYIFVCLQVMMHLTNGAFVFNVILVHLAFHGSVQLYLDFV